MEYWDKVCLRILIEILKGITDKHIGEEQYGVRYGCEFVE